MKNTKSKCTCAQRGVMCGRKLSLMKQGKITKETDLKEIICPLKSALILAS